MRVALTTAWAVALLACSHVGLAAPQGQSSSSTRTQGAPAGTPTPFKPVSPAEQKAKFDQWKKTEPNRIYHPGQAQAQAAPQSVNAAGATCSTIEIYREWRNTTASEKTGFVNALKCLTTLGARTTLPGVKNRWDDLAAIHRGLINDIHGSALFLPWHRYMMWMLKQELKTACSYTGPMIWWDETLDAGKFASAPMMNSGLDGTLPVNQANVNNGIFANYHAHIGPGGSNSDRIITRDSDESISAQITSSAIQTCYQAANFADMSECVEGIHNNGHVAIGGIMNDVSSSPADPLFYTHHLFVDHMWRIWQNVQPSRQSAVGGTYPGGAVTANTQLTSFGFYPAQPVSNFLNTQGGFLCYRYNY